MNLIDICGTEAHPVYQTLESSNRNRQYSFLQSAVYASLDSKTLRLDHTIIKALNFHAIACLHEGAGHYRNKAVEVSKGNHEPFIPPEASCVKQYMDDFVNLIADLWEKTDMATLGAVVLWGLNFIHPFVNGNGRTARAACYFVMCLKSGSWLAGSPILPELLRTEPHRTTYIAALESADDGEFLNWFN